MQPTRNTKLFQIHEYLRQHTWTNATKDNTKDLGLPSGFLDAMLSCGDTGQFKMYICTTCNHWTFDFKVLYDKRTT